MNQDDIRSFAHRDWAAVGREKARYWAERKRAMSALEALAVGDELRRHARQVRPGWPDAAERKADLADHARVAEALRAVSLHGSR